MPLPWVSRAAFDAQVALAAHFSEMASLNLKVAFDNAHMIAALTTRAQAAEAKYDELVRDVLAFKRHEVGMAPAAQDLTALDPMNSLGFKTQSAIEEFAAGDVEMRKYLVGRAHIEQASLRGKMDDMAAIDRAVAGMIRAGDR